jgi:hypothetical protein
MDFNSIVLYLSAKWMNAREIHNDLIATLGTKVCGYSTVTHWLREVQPDQFSETAVGFTERAEVDETDEAILSEFEVQPFGSVRDIRDSPVWLVPLSTGISQVHWTLGSGIFVGSHMS